MCRTFNVHGVLLYFVQECAHQQVSCLAYIDSMLLAILERIQSLAGTFPTSCTPSLIKHT